jgi:hypothetical protein
MKRSIVAAVLILFVAAACIAAISGERPVASPAYDAPPGYRNAAASASDRHGFLVVWRDTARSRSYGYERTYAARIDGSGHVLDPFGIRIPTLTTSASQFNVVYLGNAYLVCWNEGDVSVPTSPAVPLVGVRISAEGQVLDSAPRVFVDKARLSAGGVASNGSRAIIAYTSASGSLMTILLDRDANVVDGPRTLTNPAGGLNETALAASNGQGFLVVRSFGNTNYTATTALDASGVPLPATPPLIDTPGGIFGLASDGNSYVALFQAPGQITAQHFGSSGEIMETSQFPLQQVLPGLFYLRQQQVFPGLVFSGETYLFMDGDPTQKTLGIRRLTRSGQPIGGYNPIATASSTTSSSLWYNTTLAYNGSSAFAGWGSGVFSGSVIEGASLATSTPFVIARAATTQITPAAATSAANTAIVWNEDDGGVYAGRLALDGQMLDGRGIRVAGSNVTQPQIAFDGVNYIIGWREQDPLDQYASTLKVARFAPGTGTLLDPNGIVISQKSYGTLALAPAPNGTLLAWQEGAHIVATILGRDLSHGPIVTADPSEDLGGRSVSAAWNGSEWLLTWLKGVQPSGGPICDPGPCLEYQIYAARLSSQLTLLDPKPIVVYDTLDSYGQPLVASDGDGFLVAWTRSNYDYSYVEGGYEYGVYAQRISRDGSLLGPVNGARIGAGLTKSVVWDGLQYDVAFTARQYSPYFAATFASRTANLNVTHVAAHGLIESLTPQTVITDPSDPDAALIVTETGNVTVAYTRIGTEPEYGDVERVFVTVPHAIRGRASR